MSLFVFVVLHDQAYDVDAYPVAVFTTKDAAEKWVEKSNHAFQGAGGWALHRYTSDDYSIHEVPLGPAPRDAWEHPEDYA